MKVVCLFAALVAVTVAADDSYAPPKEQSYNEHEKSYVDEPMPYAEEPMSYAEEPVKESYVEEAVKVSYVEEPVKEDSYAAPSYDTSYIYQGKYAGSCGQDGLYYRDDESFVSCSNGNHYVQPCAPGTKNSGYDNFRPGGTYGYRDFCDVNLVDEGYAAKRYKPSEYEPYRAPYRPYFRGPYYGRPYGRYYGPYHYRY